MVTARGRSCCQGSEATLTRVCARPFQQMFSDNGRKHLSSVYFATLFSATPFNDYLLTVIKRCMRSTIIRGRYNASHGN